VNNVARLDVMKTMFDGYDEQVTMLIYERHPTYVPGRRMMQLRQETLNLLEFHSHHLQGQSFSCVALPAH